MDSDHLPTQQKALSIAEAALSKKASDVLILDVQELTSIADYFILASGESERQVKAIANNIAQEIATTYHTTPLIEGSGTSMWILLDYDDIVVHVFKTDIRQYYALEKMWSDAPRIPIPEQTHDKQPAHSYQTINKTSSPAAKYGS
ncbi:MAG: ribosomal silencing factor RsfS [Nitrospirales bacterium]|nr:MAG: ribosomal silencing factor RsfS [Nitrospirales bacterium]